MQPSEHTQTQSLARTVGLSLLATILIGILSAVLIGEGVDINLTADVEATARNMLEAAQRLQGKAYIASFLFVVEVLITLGLFLLLRRHGLLLASWSLVVSLGASVLSLLGAVFAMNAAQVASNPAYGDMTTDARLLLTSLQATSDYTSFHLGLVLSTLAKAGFFYLFLRSRLIPKLIAGWGVFASLFVGVTIVARDFIPSLGHNVVTAAFMACNLIALLALGFYLAIRGVRESP